jgi:hypothetical protein
METITLHGDYWCAFSRITGEDRGVVSGGGNPQAMPFFDED